MCVYMHDPVVASVLCVRVFACFSAVCIVCALCVVLSIMVCVCGVHESVFA